MAEKLSAVDEHWRPRIVARMNDYDVRIAKIQGEFVWHAHPDTDELFLVLAGRLSIELRDRTVHLEPGEIFVVPRGVEHRPRAEDECLILMLDPADTPNTGDAGGERTVAAEWI